MISTNFIKNGYLISDKLLKNEQVLSLRKDLDVEFQSHNNVVKHLYEFKNSDLIKRILNLYKHRIINEIKNGLYKISENRISVLPQFMVHKNYHVDLRERHGWHRDCGGEMKYDYCNEILGKKNYLFSKLAFYLQENNEYGGSIDVIKTSHKNFSKSKVILRKIKNIPFRIIVFFHKYLRKIYNLIPESLIMFVLNAKRLNPEIGTAVFFDSRIIHRGSPIAKKKLNEISFEKGKYQAYTPNENIKYTIYCQFGTSQATDSYFYDRLKRKNSSNELKDWIRQVDHVSKFDKELSEEILSILEPIKKKYSDYL